LVNFEAKRRHLCAHTSGAVVAYRLVMRMRHFKTTSHAEFAVEPWTH